jgi:hypothetical protein
VAGGIPFDVNKAIVLGDNLVDLGPTAQLASISAKIDLTAKEATLLQTEADIITAIESGSGGGSGGGGGGSLTAADVWSYSSRTLTTAIPTASANAAAVRTELATELGRIDVATSTRLAASAYTAPDNASVAAILTDTGTTIPAQISALNDFDPATDTVLSNVKYVNDIEVKGTGTDVDPWNPV